MHKGNPYPYHPTYWATECQFWPGYVPWKLFLNGFVTTDPALTPIHTVNGTVSESGSAPGDATQIFWRWAIDPASGVDELIVSLEQELISSVNYAAWVATVKSSGIMVGQSHLFLPSPRYSEQTGGASIWGSTHDPTPVAPLSQINLRGATYAEGGSPWS